ncbi:hypothetical protein FJ420_27065 [Mesorhizobium sp. B3-1-3]|uniref:hypothetical protein n=1 Tax=unclassified Mesorhizobium TaxID=325217 RepID=UPI001129BD59|nr:MULTISPECIES: hypothetical protein [unclassified Mesorhizobium]TPI64833.1 hypothetical protein FJ420_27065 [Mesorhizobium sp. B3-1-3]TPI69657.1 hypothetical protein FJ424_05875 [Mesorhizobium sp. B3-1-8]
MTGMARPTMAQALVRYLCDQFTIRMAKGRPLFPRVFVNWRRIVKRRAATGYEGWFAWKPNRSPALGSAARDHEAPTKGTVRVMPAAGCQWSLKREQH